MPAGLVSISMLLPAWLLVMARVGTLVLAVPIFSSTVMPRFFRVMVVVAVTAACMPAALPLLPADLSLGQAIVGLAGEFIVGILLGLAATVIFVAGQMAMQFISQQAGLSLGEVFNPLLDNESAVLEQVGFFVGLTVFVGAGGAQAIVRVLLNSFDLVPPLMFLREPSGDWSSHVYEFSAGMFDLIFRLAIRLSGPAMLAMLLSTLAMGFLVKTMPQFNVLTVGFSVKAAIALILVAATMSRWDGLMGDAMAQASAAIQSLIESASRRVAGGG